ncbi:MAG TPA: matrixin family metalloprotease [Candidatus Acidoferrales bacterium]|nr:matrixin family metalloprotease [Candidatus Acidoferrales bacterium]
MRHQSFLISILSLFILLTMTAGVQPTFADSVQAQPIFGFGWPTHSIPVAIDAMQANVRQVVLRAMNTWNLAQDWFITTYMSGVGTPFVFYESNTTSDSMITVTFNVTQTRDELGWTNTHDFHDAQGVFKKVDSEISIDLAWQDGTPLNDTNLQCLATHELGHALGLAHTTFNTSDLMYHIPKVMYPSTLNLYAVYLISQATNVNQLPQQPVLLPNDIPYKMLSGAELSTVTSPTTTQESTESLGLMQTVSSIAQEWGVIIGGIIVLVTILAVSVSRRRNRTDIEHHEPETISRPNPTLHVVPKQANASTPKCRHCGAENSHGDLICRKCGMPAGYC